ncbi:hypothetical protein, partial [Staphylococcus aureus]
MKELLYTMVVILVGCVFGACAFLGFISRRTRALTLTASNDNQLAEPTNYFIDAIEGRGRQPIPLPGTRAAQ